MTRAVVDTSVLISAFLFPESVPAQVIKLAERGEFTLCLSSILLEEFGEALRRPRLQRSYPYTPTAAEAWRDALQEVAHLVAMPLPAILATCRDPDDDHVLAAALAARADFIVTGDADLLALDSFEGIRIVPVRAFLEILAARSRSNKTS